MVRAYGDAAAANPKTNAHLVPSPATLGPHQVISKIGATVQPAYDRRVMSEATSPLLPSHAELDKKKGSFDAPSHYGVSHAQTGQQHAATQQPYKNIVFVTSSTNTNPTDGKNKVLGVPNSSMEPSSVARSFQNHPQVNHLPLKKPNPDANPTFKSPTNIF